MAGRAFSGVTFSDVLVFRKSSKSLLNSAFFTESIAATCRPSCKFQRFCLAPSMSGAKPFRSAMPERSGPKDWHGGLERSGARGGGGEELPGRFSTMGYPVWPSSSLGLFLMIA